MRDKNQRDENGNRQGYWEYNWCDGHTMANGIYNNGELQGYWEWHYSDGSIICKEFYL